jgi:hypothetical protein
MSVPLDTALHRVAGALTERIVPALDDSFAIETARLAGMLLRISANAIDDAAQLRVDENADMRSLFATANPIVTDAGLAVRLGDAAASRDPGLRISLLDVENDRLRLLLVALHAQVEQQDGDAARAIAQQIWRMLKTFEARRAPEVQPPASAS